MPVAPTLFSSQTLRAVAVTLALLMVLTRFGHFGELSRLPDASWAVFFLGGLLLRDARVFAGFFALAWLVDLGSVAAGTPVDCFSVAYLFLVPAYGALWFAGRQAAPWLHGVRAARGMASAAAGLRSLGVLSLALVAGVTAAFVVSNLGYWAFGAGFAPLSAGDYAAQVSRYLPGYLLASAIYVGAALVAGTVAARVAGEARPGA